MYIKESPLLKKVVFDITDRALAEPDVILGALPLEIIDEILTSQVFQNIEAVVFNVPEPTTDVTMTAKAKERMKTLDSRHLMVFIGDPFDGESMVVFSEYLL